MSVILAVIGGESAAFDDATIYRALTVDARVERRSLRDLARRGRDARGRAPAVGDVARFFGRRARRHRWRARRRRRREHLLSRRSSRGARARARRRHRVEREPSDSRRVSRVGRRLRRAPRGRLRVRRSGTRARTRSSPRATSRESARSTTRSAAAAGATTGRSCSRPPPGGALALPGANTSLNLTVIAETAAGLWGGSAETCYEAVRVLQGGETLTRIDGAPMRLYRHWSPPARVHARRATVRGGGDRAAQAARARRQRAARHRRRHEHLAEWRMGLAGGVRRGRERARRGAQHATSCCPVSISYPEGDPGREDELIREIAARWNAHVHWLDIQNIPFFDQPGTSVPRVRDEPFAHPFEMWHRSLARGTRATNSRVALEGVGGDQLFQVSEVYLADLLEPAASRSSRASGRRRGCRAPASGISFAGRFSRIFRAPRSRLAHAAARRTSARLLSRALAPAVDRFALRARAFARAARPSPRPSHHARVTCRS